MTTIFGGITEYSNSRPLQPLSVRAADPDEASRRMQDNLSAKIRTAMPAQVVSFNSAKQTIVAQPLIRERIIDRTTGSIQWIQLPQLLDVPVCFPQAGNFVLTMPITAGDEVVLLFNDMCMDSWWARGGVQNWNDRRRHDLSDAIAVVGINSVPHVVSNILNNGTELRSKDGNVKVTVQATALTLTVGSETIVMDNASISLNATTININGILKHNNKDITHHTHAVTTAPGTTGPMQELP